MTWWHNEITKEMSIEILEEIRVYSHHVIHRNVNGIIKGNRNGPVFRHHENHKEYKIKPEGAIIHSTQTQNVWDHVRMIANKSIRTHFIIPAHPCTWGKYLCELPSTIIMPMDPNRMVLHSAYMSKYSWGIDFRNLGRLRPWNCPIESHKPGPMFPGEETNNFFKYNNSDEPKFFWRADMWRAPFTGEAIRVGNYYYEKINKQQLLTLIILLRVLDAYEPMDFDKILPAHTLKDIPDPILPGINWNILRESVEKNVNEIPNDMINNAITNKVYKNEWYPSKRKDEDYLRLLQEPHNWRIASDEGEYKYIRNGRDCGIEARKDRAIIRKNLLRLGYACLDIEEDFRRFIASTKLSRQYPLDAINILQKKVDNYFG